MNSDPVGTPLDPKAQKRFFFGCVGTVLGTAFIVLLPLMFIKRPDPKLVNVRACATAALLYSQDNDERLPPSETWMDRIQNKYVKPAVFHAPALADPKVFGYAYRKSLGKQRVTEIQNPGDAALVFDSSDLSWNANGELNLLPVPDRVPQGNSVATVDGHARFVKGGQGNLR